MNNLINILLPRSIGRLVLKLTGAGWPCSRGDWYTGVSAGVNSAPGHAPAVLETRHTPHSTVEIGVARGQGGVLGRGRCERRS